MDPTRPEVTGEPAFEALGEKLRTTGAILHAHLALARIFEQDAAQHTPHDSTTHDLLLRIRLAPAGGIRASVLCDQMQKSSSHVSRLIERAQAKGLVERRVDPSDRRAQLVVLTEEGKNAFDDYLPYTERMLDEVVFKTLSSEEIETLVVLLTRVARAARDYASRAKLPSSE